jgi:diguanylate cyclase (GGDEF)-like protein
MSESGHEQAASTQRITTPFKIAAWYFAFGVTWVLLSDSLTGHFTKSLENFESVEKLKGIAFVAISASFLYAILRSYLLRLQKSQETFQHAELEIKKLSYYDHETGLPNHNLLIDRFNQVIALNSRSRSATAVIYISLTGFKSIVDVQGLEGGKKAMQAIADRLSSTIRQYDTIARIHRDEFALVLGGTVQEGDISVIVHKLIQVFSTPLILETTETNVPACFGIACFPTDGDKSDLLLQRAHIAMNQARQNGIAFQYFSEDINQKAIERHRLENGLLRSMEAGEFYLCYQPKISLNGITVFGMEALLRWNSPECGVVPPDKFIPIAEENGLIVKLGAWVLKEACQQNVAWQKAGLPKLKIAVNLSTRQLLDNAFLPMVMQILAETGLEPQYLEFELTESSIMGDTNESVCKLLRLKEMGISISVDDFGTGYSSLSYLKHLPIDTIKIDRSFIRDITNDPDDAAIVDAIIAMANSLNLTVIAEGVETVEQLKFLQQRTCQQAQGYYFSRPLEAPQFAAFISEGIQKGSITVSSPDTQPAKISSTTEVVKPLQSTSTTSLESVTSAEFIGDIAILVPPAHPGDNLSAVLKRFQNDPSLSVLPIVDDGRVVGIINRSTFLEEHVIGMNGFAYHINHSRKMRDLMAPVRLLFESTVRIKDAAQAIQNQNSDLRIDNICITSAGKYSGVVEINRFINAITEINLTLAKGANPLTGLPGNESIQREINDRLASNSEFDIAYIDIDNFKPFNDHYGFQRGDVVIKAIGEIINDVIQFAGEEFNIFCGHIGGDDFIVISGAHHAEYISGLIIKSLEKYLPEFHGDKDFGERGYSAINRKGEQETFGLVSLSIGIVNTRLTPVTSYAQLASLSTEVKKAAKKLPGSSIVINRRTENETV